MRTAAPRSSYEFRTVHVSLHMATSRTAGLYYRLTHVVSRTATYQMLPTPGTPEDYGETHNKGPRCPFWRVSERIILYVDRLQNLIETNINFVDRKTPKVIRNFISNFDKQKTYNIISIRILIKRSIY